MGDYKFIVTTSLSNVPSTVCRASDGAFVPLDPMNTDCQKFIVDAQNGASVLNVDGSAWKYSDATLHDLGLEPPQ